MKNRATVTIWWCIWGWADWQCYHLEIWWNTSCISASLAPDGAATQTQTHTHVLGQRAKKHTSINFYFCSCRDGPRGPMTAKGCRAPESLETYSVQSVLAIEMGACSGGIYGVVQRLKSRCLLKDRLTQRDTNSQWNDNENVAILVQNVCREPVLPSEAERRS